MAKKAVPPVVTVKKGEHEGAMCYMVRVNGVVVATFRGLHSYAEALRRKDTELTRWKLAQRDAMAAQVQA